VIVIWNGEIIAHSTNTIRVEGNHYFPPDSVDWNALVPSTTTSRCWWKGKASYYHVRAKGVLNPAAWTYENPWPLAQRRGRLPPWSRWWRAVPGRVPPLRP
jgi:uncharacterized protein (DUF427 family)